MIAGATGPLTSGLLVVRPEVALVGVYRVCEAVVVTCQSRRILLRPVNSVQPTSSPEGLLRTGCMS
jgi:hypothetical protein